METIIRQETPADRAAIEAITVSAFLEAEHTDHTEQRTIDRLREAGSLTLSLVAERKGEIVGHVAVSPVMISDGASGWTGLGPVSVSPEFQKQGIGSRLVREALDWLRRRGCPGCVVLGSPNFYRRFGFRTRPGLELPGVPSEYFMAVSFGPAFPRGTVSYHEAFNN